MRLPIIASLVFTTLLAVVTNAEEMSGRLQGTIVSRDTAQNALTVQHEAVAGLMPAMTMPYPVRGAAVASLPADGSRITAVLHTDGNAFWLTDIAAESGGEPPPAAPAMAPMHAMAMTHDATSALLMRQASGTSMNPAAAREPMHMTRSGDWMLMLHGSAFVTQTRQSGPRGGEKLFSTNWVMGMADRPLGGGHLLLRTMLSLEPLTVGDSYPELFQTGETLHGRPIVDAQHPHDFFMEVAAEYAHPIGASTIGFLYLAPFGDPSLGPVAYPHRTSAAEIPQATLGHHVQDSTHISGSVVTAGAQSGRIGYAVSAFHGAEPDENRWDIDTGRLDSWAARVTFDPTPQWTAQLSAGRLKHPEALEPGDLRRITASVAYSGMTAAGEWNSSAMFGRNQKTRTAGSGVTNSWLWESTLRFREKNYATARIEFVDKDELFAGQTVAPAVGEGTFRVVALTAGYSRDLLVRSGVSTAVGGNVTVHSIPGAIRTFYGSSPHSASLFVRLRGAM